MRPIATPTYGARASPAPPREPAPYARGTSSSSQAPPPGPAPPPARSIAERSPPGPPAMGGGTPATPPQAAQGQYDPPRPPNAEWKYVHRQTGRVHWCWHNPKMAERAYWDERGWDCVYGV